MCCAHTPRPHHRLLIKSAHAAASVLAVEDDCWSAGNGEQESVLEVAKHLLVERRILHVTGLPMRRKEGRQRIVGGRFGVRSSC